MKIYKVKKIISDIEPHEIFLDTLANSRDKKSGFSEKKFEVPIKARISYFVFAIFLILTGVLLFNNFLLQVIDGEIMKTLADNNKGNSNLIIPTRGIIYDKNMEKLVLNSPAYDLICDRATFSVSSENISKTIEEISEIIKQETGEIYKKIQKSTDSDVIVYENLNREALLALEARIDNLNGCRIGRGIVRSYIYRNIFSHILGYTARINRDEYANSKGYAINDYIGRSGLEKYYETFLRGQPGQAKPGKKSFSDDNLMAEIEPKAGNNIVLNIEAGLQKQIYQSLETSIKKIGAKKGAAIAMDPKTGAVLALVSYPSYDDNLFSGGISFENYNKLINDPNQPLLNRAISAKYPTGSIIKPLEAAAALQEKIISPEKQINDQGYILIKSQYDPTVVYKFGGVKPHGWVDMRRAIAVSSNIYFYTIGGGYEGQQGLGPSRIKKYLSLFGWDERTGVDLFGEFSGFVPNPEWKKSTKGQPWFDGDTYNLSIGQSDLQTTPIQVATAYCAIANGGTLYKPQIVNKILSSDSKQTIRQFYPQIIRQNFIDPENLKIVREGMRDAVEKDYGLSHSLNNLPVKVAAKTGTAQIGAADRFNVWSGIFAPYEDPQLVIVVTVENVSELGAVTLPVARDAINWYFSEK